MPTKRKTSINEAAAQLGSKGGRVNYEKNKATWPEKSRQAALKRWSKTKKANKKK